jgi:hypothetical protein
VRTVKFSSRRHAFLFIGGVNHEQHWLHPMFPNVSKNTGCEYFEYKA